MPRAGLRKEGGSVLPFVAFSLAVMVAFLGFSTDVLRNIQASDKLDFAARSAALYGMSFATGSDGSYLESQAMDNITAAVMSAGNAEWNDAPAGPANFSDSDWTTPVTFGSEHINFVHNPQDANELILQVTADRTGSDALKMVFLPAIYAGSLFTGGSIPDEAFEASPYRMVEVIGQPASRIGSGPPVGATETRAAELRGFAAFPLAISNQQFGPASQPSETRSLYTINLISSQSSPAPAANQLNGCFVNVAATGSNLTYYGPGQGDLAIDQLKSLWRYFSAAPELSAISPGMMERGSQVSAFDPADPAFAARKAELVAAIQQVPLNSHIIIPVIRNNPVFTDRNEVVGFARFRLVQTVNAAQGDFNIQLQIAESVPLRNASSVAGLAGIPGSEESFLPQPVAPFTPRNYVAETNSVSLRPRGVVMAPALSPRDVRPQT